MEAKELKSSHMANKLIADSTKTTTEEQENQAMLRTVFLWHLATRRDLIPGSNTQHGKNMLQVKSQ